MFVSWSKIRYCLDRIEACNSYYCGSTLCIDFDFHPNICLNLNGRGFTYSLGSITDGSELKFVMPKDVQDKVQELYSKYKLNPEPTFIDMSKKQAWFDEECDKISEDTLRIFGIPSSFYDQR